MSVSISRGTSSGSLGWTVVLFIASADGMAVTGIGTPLHDGACWTMVKDEEMEEKEEKPLPWFLQQPYDTDDYGYHTDDRLEPTEPFGELFQMLSQRRDAGQNARYEDQSGDQCHHAL